MKMQEQNTCITILLIWLDKVLKEERNVLLKLHLYEMLGLMNVTFTAQDDIDDNDNEN